MSKLRLFVRLAILVPFAAPLACAPPRTGSHAAAVTAASLGDAQSFAVLGGTTVTNTGPTVVSGNLGVDPGDAVTGFLPGVVLAGSIHAADALALQAQNADTAAYNTLAAQPCEHDLTGKDLVGLTLVPGVYCFTSSAQLSGALTLDAAGDANAVFVFKIVSTLTTASNSLVQVVNGGSDCNVFWQVGSSATLGTGTTFVGNILALTSIALTTGASVSGRAFAQTGAVTMDANRVSFAACVTKTRSDGGAEVLDGSTPVSCCQGTACGDSCFDLNSDVSHCGSCDHACAANENCQKGSCTICGKDLCGSACVDLVSDRNHCGDCGNVCPSQVACIGGFCGACPGAMCGSWCVDLKTDRHDCGRCGNACQPSETCIAGACVLLCR